MDEINRSVILYGNGGSGNHGCEAIYRGTKALLNTPLYIQSSAAVQDRKYGVDEFAQIHDALSGKPKKKDFLKAYLKLKIQKDFADMDGIQYLPAIGEAKHSGDIALSVGGDNYCYGYPQIYAYLNRAYHNAGLKTVLWGCSVEPELMKDARVAEDLRLYNLIAARESITYEAVKSVGANAVLCPDPAFFMAAQETEIDERMKKDTVGINCSPMIIDSEKHAGIVYENYRELIRYILQETDLNIALIPHVVWENSDDRTVLAKLAADFNKDERIITIEDHSAPQLKYVISKCRLFVGARTHATIAAYSSLVPTLVVGYSVKARGIAKDLFGEDENYILSAQGLQENSQLTEKFIKLCANEKKVHETLAGRIPSCRTAGIVTVEKVRKL